MYTITARCHSAFWFQVEYVLLVQSTLFHGATVLETPASEVGLHATVEGTLVSRCHAPNHFVGRQKGDSLRECREEIQEFH